MLILFRLLREIFRPFSYKLNGSVKTFPVYECYIGKPVRKGFWFQGRVTSLDVGETENVKEVILVHVEFDDGDKEDYELHEWECEIEIDDKSNLSDGKYHPLGAVVWKKFVLERDSNRSSNR